MTNPASQQPAPIPEGLKRIGHDVHYPDVCNCDIWPGDGGAPECKIQPRLEPIGDWLMRLIERISTLTKERDGLREALACAISECDARDYRPSLGNYDQLNQLREILIRAVSGNALAAPLGTPGREKP
jgi:hypothetical protein